MMIHGTWFLQWVLRENGEFGYSVIVLVKLLLTAEHNVLAT